MPEASNKFTVHCDICQEQMEESAMAGYNYRSWYCYPCNNVIYESDLWRFDSAVEVHREVDVSQGA